MIIKCQFDIFDKFLHFEHFLIRLLPTYSIQYGHIDHYNYYSNVLNQMDKRYLNPLSLVYHNNIRNHCRNMEFISLIFSIIEVRDIDIHFNSTNKWYYFSTYKYIKLINHNTVISFIN